MINNASIYFPDEVKDECLKAYQKGQGIEALSADEVLRDEARKAKWTFERQQPTMKSA